MFKAGLEGESSNESDCKVRNPSSCICHVQLPVSCAKQLDDLRRNTVGGKDSMPGEGPFLGAWASGTGSPDTDL